METDTNTPVQTKEEKKREYMREYMRKYKAKKYAEDAESIRRANRTRYLTKTHAEEIDADDRKRYGNHLADIIALRELVHRIPQQHITDVIQMPF
jgi:hypothetical protein